MRSETVIVGETVAVVRSRTRRTPIVEAIYKKALVRAHPEIEEFERAQNEALTADLTIDANGKIKTDTPDQAAAFARYTLRFSAVQHQQAVGAAYAAEAKGFIPLLARICELHNTNFDLTPPQFMDEQVNAAFEDWLDGEHEDFWTAISTAVATIDEPLTPVEQRPPEALTDEERNDPLSVEAASAGSKA